MHNKSKIVWDKCLLYIRGQISEQTYKTWFAPILAKDFKDSVLTIQVPSQFFYEWLEEHYFSLLKQAVQQEIGPNGRLEYAVVIDQGNKKQKPLTINLPTYPGPAFSGAIPAEKTSNYGNNFFPLNPNYLFDNLVEGSCNQLAKSAAQAVASNPGGTAFNPLMLYGGVGLGKTHISQAIGNAVRVASPNKRIIYISSEKFTTQFIEALRNNNVKSFTEQYLATDLLFLDDIQFLSGKEKTQEIFFHIFNHLHQFKKQIVITSDCAPRDLKGLQERLLSRFKWGLTADLQRPDFETRIAIIHSKIAADGINFPENLIEYIAKHVDTNVRELEGVLISIIAHASLAKKDINIELAKQVLKHIVQHHATTKTTIELLQQQVAAHFNISLDNLKGKSRKKEIVGARQIGMHLAKKYTAHSLKSIGEYFGGRDHTTVMHAIQVVDGQLSKDSHYVMAYRSIENQIKTHASFY
ncbi:chromosomal replication initiator protein DnaA [Cardinium endosymbiont of Culicoides punctatus]|uniref:chromosomal replication initiator protein DnaA n=1 Tax=Cardinium endosymbiont of Culicoides punctatus TaxID=2304601 RepID=UPI00105883FE|nr:chromosomal replication initiator protein DnaA [Cardinium endosymbiont of Culicoides punctatus]TDG95727.1 Chromosomal replication initiator protein DnaA [Cardinium endosymbiont of Culicoides punctatus]